MEGPQGLALGYPSNLILPFPVLYAMLSNTKLLTVMGIPCNFIFVFSSPLPPPPPPTHTPSWNAYLPCLSGSSYSVLKIHYLLCETFSYIPKQRLIASLLPLYLSHRVLFMSSPLVHKLLMDDDCIRLVSKNLVKYLALIYGPLEMFVYPKG